MAADTERCLGELRAGNLVPRVYKDLAAAKVSRKQRRGWGSTVRGEDAPKPAKPTVSQSHPCHQHTAGHWQGTGGAPLLAQGKCQQGPLLPRAGGLQESPSCGQVKHCPNRASGPCSRHWPGKWLQLLPALMMVGNFLFLC